MQCTAGIGKRSDDRHRFDTVRQLAGVLFARHTSTKQHQLSRVRSSEARVSEEGAQAGIRQTSDGR
jgi:hypothetical protein